MKLGAELRYSELEHLSNPGFKRLWGVGRAAREYAMTLRSGITSIERIPPTLAARGEIVKRDRLAERIADQEFLEPYPKIEVSLAPS